MISNWLSAALARRNIHYGWVMVGVTFLTALVSAGAVGAPGVFIVPLQKEFGWTTAEISSALSIRFILFGLMAPFAAALMNRYGLRNVTLSALLTVVTGAGALAGNDPGLATDPAVGRRGRHRHRHDRAGARRYRRRALVQRRGAGWWSAFSPPARRPDNWYSCRCWPSLTELMGWRTALGLMCGMLGVAAFAVLMVMRDRPSDLGLRPFGDESTAASAGAAAEQRADHGGGARHAARCCARPAPSGSCSRPSSSAAPAPTA